MGENLLDIVKIKTQDFSCFDEVDSCFLIERTLSYALFVDIPKQEETPDEVFKECCYIHKVLASLTDSDLFKNDFSGFYHKRQTPGETCEFVMVDLATTTEYVLNDNTYGEFKDFNSIQNQPNLTLFRLEWREVLTLLGSGPYKVLKRINIAGLTI